MKRKEFVVEDTKRIIESLQSQGNAKDAAVIITLLKEYEYSTFKEWNDRYDFYFLKLEEMLNDTLFNPKETAKKLANMHPTLQQSFMRLATAFMQQMVDKAYVDDRNRKTQELSKKMLEAVKDDIYLPFI